MEYAKESWGSYAAPRDNRFIITHDESNAEFSTLDVFHEQLKAFKPTMVVVTGFHLLDGLNPKDQTERLNKILARVSAIPSHVPVHFELASIGDEDLLKRIVTAMFGKFDSLGLNEQEIASVAVALSDKFQAADKKFYVDPTVERAFTAMDAVFEAADLHESRIQASRRLTRIHLHTLKFHIVAHRDCKNPAGCYSWHGGMPSVVAGVLRSTRQACDNEDIDVTEVHPLVETQALHLPGSSKAIVVSHTDAVLEWTHKDYHYFYAQVLVCKEPKRTVGLGDAISSTGLVYEFVQN